MSEERVHEGWRTTAKIFIGLFILCCLIMFFTFVNSNQLSQSLQSCWKQSQDSEQSCQKNINDNYDYKCSQGTYKQCVENGKYALTYDTIQQTSVVCNKIDGLFAQCVQKGAYCLSCPAGSHTGCFDDNGKFVTPLS